MSDDTINQLVFPNPGRFRILDRYVYFIDSIFSILRNKRRSVSMIAGLILGMSILSGILLYTTVVMNNVYDTVIAGSPYEIRFDFKGDSFNDSDLKTYQQQFLSNPKILDAQFLYGNARAAEDSRFGGAGPHERYRALAFLGAQLLVEYSNQTVGSVQGILFSQSFFNSDEIGQRFKDKLISGKDANIYSNSSSYFHGAFISEKLAEKARLRQGNELKQVTLSIFEQDPEDPFRQILMSEIALENITIAGLISSDTGANAGIFSEAFNIGTTGMIYLPEELAYEQNQTAFLTRLKENEMKYSVLKINEDEFNLADPVSVNSQINRLINEYEKENEIFIGTNLVEGQLLPFQMLSIFIFVFDGILTIPVAILSIYLLSFGIDLSLHERRFQVGMLKIQGASPNQIKRKILFDALLLALIGLIIGYIISIFGAWGIGTATGFMKWNWDYAFQKLPHFIYFDELAFFVVGGFICLILFFMVNGKANIFIEMEIVESVRRTEEKQKNFLRRNNLDLIFFATGLVTLVLVILIDYFSFNVDLGTVGILLAILGPPLFWIGGAALIARLAVWLPSKTDSLIKRIGFLKDVSILIRGNIFRKAGDMPRLALIIALTMSFSVLAAIQGVTGEHHKQRLVTFDVGADLTISTNLNLSTSVIASIKNCSSDVEDVMALCSTSGIFFNDPVELTGIDSEIYAKVGKWQQDSVPNSNEFELMNSLEVDPNGVLLGKNILKEQALEIGESFTLEILTYHWNGTFINYDFIPRTVTVRGIFDHCPGGIDASGILIDQSLLNTISNISALAEIYDKISPATRELIPEIIQSQVDKYTGNPKEVLATRYLIKTKDGVDANQVKQKIATPENSWIILVKTLPGEIKKADEIQNVDFGIPGLLTADFLTSLIAATLATFIFMSILMEQRKREFAILRSYGVSNRQIYKIVFSESIVLLLMSVIWGLIIGTGLSILFNSFFEFLEVFTSPMSEFFSGNTINRIIVFDFAELIGTLLITFLGMIFATFLSVRGAANAKISTVVREL